MISLLPSSFFVVMLSLPLILISALAFYYTLRNIHQPRHNNESIYICTECGHTYALARNRPMDRCPNCNHLNEAVRT